jgi:ATP-binding cassette, subfamily C (CFTR/MRP), member 10
MYWKSVGSLLTIGIMLSLIFMQISRNTTDLWLSHWVTSIAPNSTNLTHFNADSKVTSNTADHDFGVLEIIHSAPNKSNDDVMFYLSIYAGFAVMNAIFTLFRAFMFAYGGIQAAITIHRLLLKKIMKVKYFKY